MSSDPERTDRSEVEGEMSRSVKLNTDDLRELQARSQEADRIGPDPTRTDNDETD
jgi:hypothetical protein